MATRPTTSHLFTVRLWQEDVGDGQHEWRGKVTHVLSGETRHFREWPALVDFLSAIPPLAQVAPPGMPGQTTLISGDDETNEEYAQRHCLMMSQEAGEGTPGSAIIW